MRFFRFVRVLPPFVAARGAPCFYLRQYGWDSLAAVSAAFAEQPADELLADTPFVKLRACERECVPPLAALGAGSWLGKLLSGAAAPGGAVQVSVDAPASPLALAATAVPPMRQCGSVPR